MEVFGINTVDTSNVRRIAKKMGELGPPKIRTICHNGKLYAIEGTHRLRAAEVLRLRPAIIVVGDDTTAGSKQIPGEDGNRSKTVAELRATYLPASNNRAVFVVPDEWIDWSEIRSG